MTEEEPGRFCASEQVMDGHDLEAWQRRGGIRTQKEATHALRLSFSAYPRSSKATHR
jgi:hypothetical protein